MDRHPVQPETKVTTADGLNRMRLALEDMIDGAGGGGGGSCCRPLVDGSDPPVFIINADNDLIMVEG